MSNEYSQIPSQAKPQVVAWFKIYSAFLCFLYFAVVAASLFFFFADPADVGMSAVGAGLMGALFLLMGLGLFAACLVPLLLSPRPWL
jgi:predicted Na+-dependent transporter